jgi:hypothetical protein
MPCSRASSVTLWPASCCFKMPMICSSLKSALLPLRILLLRSCAEAEILNSTWSSLPSAGQARLRLRVPTFVLLQGQGCMGRDPYVRQSRDLSLVSLHTNSLRFSKLLPRVSAVFRPCRTLPNRTSCRPERIPSGAALPKQCRILRRGFGLSRIRAARLRSGPFFDIFHRANECPIEIRKCGFASGLSSTCRQRRSLKSFGENANSSRKPSLPLSSLRRSERGTVR